MKPKTMDELDDDLCNYCPLDESQKGVHCYGGMPTMCEGSHCDEAYQNYLDDYEEENMVDSKASITIDMNKGDFGKYKTPRLIEMINSRGKICSDSSSKLPCDNCQIKKVLEIEGEDDVCQSKYTWLNAIIAYVKLHDRWLSDEGLSPIKVEQDLLIFMKKRDDVLFVKKGTIVGRGTISNLVKEQKKVTSHRSLHDFGTGIPHGEFIDQHLLGDSPLKGHSIDEDTSLEDTQLKGFYSDMIQGYFVRDANMTKAMYESTTINKRKKKKKSRKFNPDDYPNINWKHHSKKKRSFSEEW